MCSYSANDLYIFTEVVCYSGKIHYSVKYFGYIVLLLYHI